MVVHGHQLLIGLNQTCPVILNWVVKETNIFKIQDLHLQKIIEFERYFSEMIGGEIEFDQGNAFVDCDELIGSYACPCKD
ncbi:hypothetical protein DAPPUDRAFT_274230, partial [Daphnia pulex]